MSYNINRRNQERGGRYYLCVQFELSIGVSGWERWSWLGRPTPVTLRPLLPSVSLQAWVPQGGCQPGGASLRHGNLEQDGLQQLLWHRHRTVRQSLFIVGVFRLKTPH